jgi:hypothetical protein
MPRYKGEVVYGAEDELEWHKQTNKQFVTHCLNSSVSNHHGLVLVPDLICDIYQCAYLNCSQQNTGCHWREFVSQLLCEIWKCSENEPDVQITNCHIQQKGEGTK